MPLRIIEAVYPVTGTLLKLAVELTVVNCALTQPTRPFRLICHQVFEALRPTSWAIPPTGSSPVRRNCVPGPLRMTTLNCGAVRVFPVSAGCEGCEGAPCELPAAQVRSR